MDFAAPRVGIAGLDVTGEIRGVGVQGLDDELQDFERKMDRERSSNANRHDVEKVERWFLHRER